MRERHRGLRLHVRQQSTRPLLDDVRAGHLDVAVGLCVQDPGGLETQRLKDEPVFLAVPAEHRLAGQARVDVQELREETFALDDPSDGPDYNAAVSRSAPVRASLRARATTRPTTTPGRTPSSTMAVSASPSPPRSTPRTATCSSSRSTARDLPARPALATHARRAAQSRPQHVHRARGRRNPRRGLGRERRLSAALRD